MVFKPEDMIITIDTREQRPFCFEFENVSFKTRSATLDTGDYSALFFEHLIAIERKSLQDLIQSMTKDRSRFVREMQRLKAYPVKAIIVEASWNQIKMKQYRSRTHPNSVIGSLTSWIANYGIPVIMAENSRMAAELCAKIIYHGVRGRVNEMQPFLENQKNA